MDPADVHVLTSHTRQGLNQSKQEEDWVCAPSPFTFLISFLNKYPFLPLLWNLEQTSVLPNKNITYYQAPNKHKNNDSRYIMIVIFYSDPSY